MSNGLRVVMATNTLKKDGQKKPVIVFNGKRISKAEGEALSEEDKLHAGPPVGSYSIPLPSFEDVEKELEQSMFARVLTTAQKDGKFTGTFAGSAGPQEVTKVIKPGGIQLLKKGQSVSALLYAAMEAGLKSRYSPAIAKVLKAKWLPAPTGKRGRGAGKFVDGNEL